MQTVSVEFKNVSLGYEDKQVLTSIDLTIFQGKLVSLVGLNGCGKSTLLKSISGMLLANNGLILLKNRPIDSYKLRELSKIVSFVEKINPEHLDLRVIDLVLLGRLNMMPWHGFPSQNDLSIAKQALIDVDLEHLSNRRMNEISSGELQRVLTARALCQNTDIILLDEPFANVDIPHQYRLYQLLRKRCNELNTTIILSSHDPNLDLLFADTIIMIKNSMILTIIDKDNFNRDEDWSNLYEIPMKCIKIESQNFHRTILLPHNL